MATQIPSRMRAIVLERYGESASDAIEELKVAERPIPKLRRGQVLVRIEAAPCNPSDLLLLQGKYGTMKTLPTVPGWEGAGRVVASGGGWMAKWLNGKRVACAVQGDRDGTWAEYCVANADECIPLKAQFPIEQAASLIINPMTAVGLLATARRGDHKAAVHTAGASQLGRMLIALASDDDFPLIHVVRRGAQVELLKSLGASHVLNSSTDGFPERLKALCEQVQATAAFEAIGGEMTGIVHNAMPHGSTIYVYGALSESACSNIDPVELIFHAKTIQGFFLGQWLQGRGVLGTIRDAYRVQRLVLDGQIQTKIQRKVNFDEAVDGLKQYVAHMTEGKVLIVPQKRCPTQ